jgi:ATP-dependent DNA helicase RecG
MGTNEVDAALAAAPAQVGARLLALTEDQWFDRKSAAIAPKDLAMALVAFANAEGGMVVVGARTGRCAAWSMPARRSTICGRPR